MADDSGSDVSDLEEPAAPKAFILRKDPRRDEAAARAKAEATAKAMIAADKEAKVFERELKLGRKLEEHEKGGQGGQITTDLDNVRRGIAPADGGSHVEAPSAVLSAAATFLELRKQKRDDEERQKHAEEKTLTPAMVEMASGGRRPSAAGGGRPCATSGGMGRRYSRMSRGSLGDISGDVKKLGTPLEPRDFEPRDFADAEERDAEFLETPTPLPAPCPAGASVGPKGLGYYKTTAEKVAPKAVPKQADKFERKMGWGASPSRRSRTTTPQPVRGATTSTGLEELKEAIHAVGESRDASRASTPTGTSRGLAPD
ncbi:hypothetical protein JL722_7276 [Aureococcus anophagefferens]|nr:hypothetical protein JL722_7276 [Aureococcus anophagefferens]